MVGADAESAARGRGRVAAEGPLFSRLEGETRAGATSPDTMLRRLGYALACVLFAANGLASHAGAAELVEIRVGVHPGFTRVVFELDSEAGYSIARPAAGADELVVDLAAHSLRRVVTSRSDLVETVRIEPSERGSVARIRLRGGAVQVADMLLLHPPRVVVDLRKPSSALASAGKPAPAEAESTEPAPAPEQVETSEAPAQASSEEAEVVEPPVTPGADGELPAVDAEEATLVPDEEPVASAQPPEEHAQELAGGETDLGEAMPSPPAETSESPPETTQAFEPGAAPREPGTAERRWVGAPEGAGTGLPAPFDDARVLLAAAAALVVLLILFATIRMRRRAAGVRAPEFPPFEEESEEPVVEARAEEDLGALAVPQAQEFGGEGRPTGAASSSIFDTGYDVEPADGAASPHYGSGPATQRSLGASATLPSAAAPLRAAGIEPERREEELERRVAHLEKRLDEVAEAKDRLERQLSTQNEELRVQRAAIARTQRVLRNLSQPGDAATEPALKGPTPPGGGTSGPTRY